MSEDIKKENKEDEEKEKTFKSKNIKFFYSNSEDLKILEFFAENNKVKFGTIVKELLISYIDSQKEQSFKNDRIEITQETINSMVKKALDTYSNEKDCTKPKIEEIPIKAERINIEKTIKSNKKVDLLNQIKNLDK